MIKRFTEMKTSGKKRESGLVRSAKLLVASVRNLGSEIDKTDKTVNSVYASFSDTSKNFTESQVKKAVVAFAKMDKTLSRFFKKSYANLKTALCNDLPTDRITSQLEDISGLRAKIAILRGQAAASLGYEGADEDEELSEDLVEIDEAGYEVDAGYEADESVADFEAEIGSEADTEAGKEAGTEAGTEAGKEAAEIPDEMKNPNEYQTQEPGKQEEIVTAQEEEEEEEENDIMDDIELEDSGMDEILGDEILGDELGPVEEEEEEEEAGEMSAMATLRKKKVASSKTQKGGISDENTVMSALMEELLSK